MDFEKLTIKAQEALTKAQTTASEYGHQSIEDFHLMYALLQQSDGLIPAILQKLEVNPDLLKDDLANIIKKYPKVSGQNVQIYMGAGLNNILDNSFKEAQRLKDEFVSTEHLLIALSEGRGKVAELLRARGVTKDRIYRILVDIRG